MSALILRQVGYIGIMKAIGGLTRQLVTHVFADGDHVWLAGICGGCTIGRHRRPKICRVYCGANA